jgi:hypothetical protein
VKCYSVRKTGKEHKFGEMAVDMKGNGWMIKLMVKVFYFMQMVMCTEDSGNKIRLMDMELINIRMELLF